MENDKVLEFWDEQAIVFQENSLATQPDTISFELEKEEMLKYLKDGQTVLNVGCGNGLNDIEYCKFNRIKLKSIDYSEEMINIANKILGQKKDDLKGDLNFEQGNILNMEYKNEFDVVMTDRCLINLDSESKQIFAINNIFNALNESGIYLMMECTKLGLVKINEVRKSFRLEEIKERWHNNYLSEEVIEYAKKRFGMMEINNFCSTYFLISRTINAICRNHLEPINYISDINLAAAKLPPSGDFAPLKLFVLKKNL